jgi:hypothetical protein
VIQPVKIIRVHWFIFVQGIVLAVNTASIHCTYEDRFLIDLGSTKLLLALDYETSARIA